MLRQLKAFEQRLARLVRVIRADAIREECERGLHRTRKVFAEIVREGLRRVGLDPDESPTLRALDEPAPPPPPPRRWRRPDPRDKLIEEARKLAARMHHPPPLASASVMELFAYYCVGPGARDEPAPTPA